MRTVTGTLRWFTLASAAVWLSFLLDWIAVLPVPLRMVQGAFWVGLLLLAFRAIFLAVRVPARESELAAMVEQSSRELEDSLITAVQLTDPDNPRRHYYNPDMIRRTVELAEEKVANLKPGQFLTWSRARRTFLLWLLLLVPAILAVEHRPGLVSSFIARNVYFENQPWPQNYELVILQPENPVMTLAKGSALVVDIRKDRGGNARGFLEVFFPETQDRSSIQEEIGLDRKGEDGFRHVFQNLQRDLEFRAHCGDYTSQWYRIQVRARPRIEELELYYEFPEYTGLLSDSENPAVRSGHVKAPVGTIVTYRARVSLPLASAVRVESRPSGDGEELIRQPLTPGADNILEGSFPAEVDSRWWFELESQEKFVNEGFIQLLLQQLDSDSDDQCRVKAMYAISCIARESPETLAKFGDSDGWSVVLRAVQRDSVKLVTKGCYFISASVGASSSAARQMMDMGMVTQLAGLLAQEFRPHHEQVLAALRALVNNSQEAKEQAKEAELGLERLLLQRREELRGQEEFEECVEHCEKILQLLSPEFIPTGEWQEVQEWQGVPPGLHVKVDLETGRKMARREEPSSADR
mgnify:CR=1 FL=1